MIKDFELMHLETERLILRPFRQTDVQAVYRYAKDRRVGPAAGWPPHRSVEESAEVIRTILSQDGVFALTLKGDDTAIGCIGLIRGAASNFPIGDREGEISYWIGVPFWGRGYIPEAIRGLMRYGFEDLNLTTLWCGYFDGNQQSKRAQEKCGFRHHRTEKDKFFELTDDLRTVHVSRITREEWMGINP